MQRTRACYACLYRRLNEATIALSHDMYSLHLQLDVIPKDSAQLISFDTFVTVRNPSWPLLAQPFAC